MDIILSTLNARYIHASLGLRYLRANLGENRERAQILEFTTKRPAQEIAHEILRHEPSLVGFGVYIWNTDQTLEVVKHLKKARPELLIVAGGPEISFETETQELYHCVDFVFKGESDHSFRDFVRNWRMGILPEKKIISAPLPKIAEIVLPYDEYSDHDLAHRTVYVEASRGCPYKCEYCLSSLDISVRGFPLDPFLTALERLLERGAKQFKFVDRTFNLSPTTSTRILGFFLERMKPGLFLHFEMVPDRLPDELKALIEQFPPGSLQFEIGVQTWSETVAKLVSRRQNYEKVRENFRYLKSRTGVHTHADLIVGLPGETWESFAEGFNQLYALEPDEIQVGVLKRLKGAPIIRHDREYQMRYSPRSPFTVRETRHLSQTQIERLSIFADFWDRIGNSGHFPQLKRKFDDPFGFFYPLTQWLYARFGRTHSIHLRELEEALTDYLKDFSSARVESLKPELPARQARHWAAAAAANQSVPSLWTSNIH